MASKGASIVETSVMKQETPLGHFQHDIEVARKRMAKEGRICFFILNFLLFSNNLDPFYVYKEVPPNGRPKKMWGDREERILSRPELRVERGVGDQWRGRLSKLLIVLGLYFIQKVFIKETLLIKHLEKYPCKKKSVEANEDDPRFICKFESCILGLVQNDLLRVILIYMGLCCILSRYLVQRLPESMGFNAAPIRFWIDPKREQMRMDFLIKDIVEEIKVSHAFFRAQMFDSIRFQDVRYPMFKDKYEDRLISEENLSETNKRESLSFIMDMLQDDLRRLNQLTRGSMISELRPALYDVAWFIISRRIAAAIFPLEVVFVQLFGILFAAYLVQQALLSSNKQPLGSKHYIFFAESAIFIQICNQIYVITSMIGASFFLFYFKLLSIARNELKNSLEKLSDISNKILESSREQVGDRLSKRNKGPSLKGRHNQKSDNSKLKLEANTIASDLLIRFMIYRHELRNLALGVNSTAGILMVALLSVVSCMMLMEFLDFGERFFYGRYILLPAAAVLSNVLAILYAICSEGVIQLERLSWSVLARMVEIASKQHDDIEIWKQTGGLGFSSYMWRRFVCRSDNWRCQLSPRPLGLTINYHRIFEANFLAISIATIFIFG